MTRISFLLLSIIVIPLCGFRILCNQSTNIIFHNETSIEVRIPDISDKYLKRDEIWKRDTLEITLLLEAKYYTRLRGVPDSIVDGTYKVSYILLPPKDKVNLRFKSVSNQSLNDDFYNLKVVVIKAEGHSIMLKRIKKNNYTIIN